MNPIEKLLVYQHCNTCIGWLQTRVWALTQNQPTRSQRARIGYFERWNNSFTLINLAYLREIWPPLVLSYWYLGSNFFGKGSDTSFTSLVSLPLDRCQLILSQGSNHPLVDFQPKDSTLHPVLPCGFLIIYFPC